MKPNKEQVLLVVVILAVAGIGAMDKGYQPVPVPSTQAPTDVPPPPGGSDSFPRTSRPSGRSLLDSYSDLVAPPFAELSDLPVPRIPVAVPPVRPWFHVDAAVGLRHYFFEPAEPPAKEEEVPAEEPAAADAGGGEGGEEEGVESAVAPAKPVDLSLFDWVIARDGLGQKIYGKIELLPADQGKGKSRYHLLADPAMEFTFWQITVKDGKFQGGPVPFRSRTEQLGFADTFANNYGSKRILMEQAAGRTNLDIPQLRELAAWSLEEGTKPKYRKRECWTQAAADYREALRRNANDRDTLKELGRTLRRLHDLEGECQLYEWWLKALPKDEEMLALHGEVLELLGLRDRARAAYETSLKTLPDAAVRLRLANLLLDGGSLGDAKRAAEEFRRAAQDGGGAAGAVGEARALLALAEFKGAAAVLERVPASERDAGWYNASGALAYIDEKLDEARGSFQAALEKSVAGDGQLAVARTNLAVAKARIAAALGAEDAARKGGLAEAVKTAEEALKDDPLNFYWPLVAKAYALRASGAKDLAVEAVQEAVAAWPQEPYGRYLLGEFLLRDGRPAEARTQFLESARLAPRFPDALAGVGRAGGGAPGEPKEFIRRAMGLEPRYGRWPILAARVAILDEAMPVTQRLEAAQADLAYLLEKVDKSHPLGLVAMGWVRYYRGDAVEALARWNAAQSVLTGFKGTPAEQEQADAIKAWVKESITKVYKWQNTRIMRDEFNRPNGPAVGNLWQVEKKTFPVSLRDGGVQFGPGQAVEGEKPTLWREFDSAKVLKASFDVTMAPTASGALEVLFRLPQGKTDLTVLGLIRRLDGSAVVRFKKDQKAKTEAEEYIDLPGFTWPADGKVTFGFVKMNEEKGAITLLLNGKPVAGAENVEVLNLIKSRGGKIRLEVKCYAPGGTELDCRVEAAEVWLDVQ